MQKIRQRFSLAHSTHTMSTSLKQSSMEYDQKQNNKQQPRQNNNSPQKPPKHRKKKSLGEAIFKHLPQKLLHHDHDNDDHHKPKKKKSLSFSAGNKKLNITPLNNKAKKGRFRKGSNGSNDAHDNKPRSLNRSNSIGNNNNNRLPGIPQAEEHEADWGVDEYDDYEHEHDPYFSLSSSSPRGVTGKVIPPSSPLPKLKKSLSSNSIGSNHNYANINVNNINNIHNGHLPPPQSPRKDVEHEKNTLIEQMRQLQKSMMQLGEMLSDQDNKLAIEKKKNENLTEQVNNLADENMELRAQIGKHRNDRNKIWHDLEFYKLSARQCKEKNIILGNQLVVVNQQKSTLLDHTQKLNAQLSTEKDKTRKLTLKIRKYSKNVKSLHKKTHSMSGLSKYRNYKSMKMKKPRTQSNALTNGQYAVSPTNGPYPNHPTLSLLPSSDPGVLTPTSLDIVSEPETKSQVDEATQNHLQKKQAEILELEKQTLELLNQLREETQLLLGETKGMKKRSDKRLKNGHRHSPKTKSGKKGNRRNKKKATPKQSSLDEALGDAYDDYLERIDSETETIIKQQKVTETKKKGDTVIEVAVIKETRTVKTTLFPQRKGGKSQQIKSVHFADKANQTRQGLTHQKEGYSNDNNNGNNNNTNKTNKKVPVTAASYTPLQQVNKSSSGSSTSSEETESAESSSTEEGGIEDIHQVLGKIAKRPSIDHNGDIDDLQQLRNEPEFMEQIKEEEFEEYPQSETPILSGDDEENVMQPMNDEEKDAEINRMMLKQTEQLMMGVVPQQTIESEDENEEYDQTDDDDDEDEEEDDDKRASIIEQKRDNLNMVKKAGAGVGLQLDAFAALMDAEGSDSENEEPEPDQPLSFVPSNINNDDDGLCTLDDLW